MDKNQRKRKHDMDHNKKSHFYKKPNRNYLVAGQRGFLATCNFREKECARECIKILSQYADNLYGKEDYKKSTGIGATKSDESATKSTNIDELNPTSKVDTGDEIEDISITLQKEIDATVTAHKQKLFRFQQLDTGASNSIFIRTTLSNPVELGVKIVRDIAEAKQHQSRFVLRLIPIEIVCKANMKEILNEAGKLFDKHFLNCPPKTFSIMFNRRYNNDLGRDQIIGELAELIKYKNVHHKVDLSTPAFTVIVEIIKGLCCLSVIPDYLLLKKYNLFELANNNAANNNDKLKNDETKTEIGDDNISTFEKKTENDKDQVLIAKTDDKTVEVEENKIIADIEAASLENGNKNQSEGVSDDTKTNEG